MQFTFTLMEEADARAICAWQYEAPYAIYNRSASDDGLAEMLDRRSPHYAVRNDDGELEGFFCYGTSAQVWGNEMPDLYSEDMTIDIGLGMRPDLTGKGHGLAFVSAGVDFARTYFRPQRFRLFVLAFNERAMLVYERASFARAREFTRQNMQGEVTFVVMQRPV